MNNSLKLKSHPEFSSGSREILHSVQNDESGRTLVEMLATLSIIGLLAWGVVRVYNGMVTRVKVQNTAKMIQTLTFERQNSAINSATGGAMNVKGPHSALHLQNGTRGNHEPYFWVETTIKDESFCKGLKESDLIQAEFVEVDGVQDGTCTDNSKIAFYFKKDKGGSAYCPSNATNCNQYGDATGCEEGYFLDNGVCSACGAHVATCEDENIATSCETGYELYNGMCATLCTFDLDCASVCSSCEDGICTNECEIPTPDANQDCGENECIVYDEDTQTCKNACTQVEYLESTETQYIDTEVDLNANTISEGEFELNENYSAYQFSVFGGGNPTNSPSHRLCFYNGYVTFWNGRAFVPSNISATSGKKINFKIEKEIFTVNDSKKYFSNTASTNNQSAYMFAYRNLSTRDAAGFVKAKFYNLRIKKDGTLVRDFVPVSSPKGNCMFDRVTQKLFCNQGTGDDFKTNLDE